MCGTDIFPSIVISFINEIEKLCPIKKRGYVYLFMLFMLFLNKLVQSYWIKLLLQDHPFKGYKVNLWISIICAILSKIREERNNRIFKNSSKPSKDILDSSIFNALVWCKDIQPLKDHNLNFLVANWTHLLDQIVGSGAPLQRLVQSYN